MKISTRYDIGHEFWAPLVLEQQETESVTVDHNVYDRSVTVLTVAAQARTVVAIDISVGPQSVKTLYRCENLGINDGWTKSFMEDDLVFVFKDDALNFARLWRDREGQAFHGVTGHLDDQTQ